MRRPLVFCCTLAGLLGSLGVVVAQNPGPSAPPPDPNTVKLVGERSVVDSIGVTGYYQLVSMLLNVDRYLLPDGVQPELKPLR